MMAIFLLFLMGLPAMDAKKKHSTIRITTDPTVYGHFIDGSVHKQWEYTFTSRLYPQKEQDQIVFSGTGSLAIQLWPFSN